MVISVMLWIFNVPKDPYQKALFSSLWYSQEMTYSLKGRSQFKYIRPQGYALERNDRNKASINHTNPLIPLSVPPSSLPFLERRVCFPPPVHLHDDSAKEVEPTGHSLKSLTLGTKVNLTSLSRLFQIVCYSNRKLTNMPFSCIMFWNRN